MFWKLRFSVIIKIDFCITVLICQLANRGHFFYKSKSIILKIYPIFALVGADFKIITKHQEVADENF